MIILALCCFLQDDVIDIIEANAIQQHKNKISKRMSHREGITDEETPSRDRIMDTSSETVVKLPVIEENLDPYSSLDAYIAYLGRNVDPTLAKFLNNDVDNDDDNDADLIITDVDKEKSASTHIDKELHRDSTVADKETYGSSASVGESFGVIRSVTQEMNESDHNGIELAGNCTGVDKETSESTSSCKQSSTAADKGTNKSKNSDGGSVVKCSSAEEEADNSAHNDIELVYNRQADNSAHNDIELVYNRQSHSAETEIKVNEDVSGVSTDVEGSVPKCTSLKGDKTKEVENKENNINVELKKYMSDAERQKEVLNWFSKAKEWGKDYLPDIQEK